MKNTLTITALVFLLILCSAKAQQTPTIQKKFNKEIERLAKHRKVKSAFSLIDDQEGETMKDLVTLTEIIAPPFKEQRRGEAFAQMLKEAGVDSLWTDKVGNVIGLRKGTDNDSGFVGVDAHLDVVFPEGTDVQVSKVGDTLKAPGIGDDTRGLTMIISMLKAMNRAQIKTEKDLLFVGTVGEEGLGDLRGMKYIFNESGLKINSWISIDGGSLGRISNAGLGSKRYKLVIKGDGGHSWGDFGLANPHHALGHVIKTFSDNAWQYTSGNIPKTSFNVGRIGGGTSVNSIPFESCMEVDMRAVDPQNLAEIETLFKNAVQVAIDQYNGSGIIGRVGYELIQIGDRPSGELSAELPLIQRAMAVSKYFGVTPQLSRGSTNINIPVSLGIPSVCIGRGGQGGGAHSLHEWYVNDETGPESIKLALLLTISQAGLKN